MKVIDADSHINSPPDLWQKRVPESYRDRAPKMVDMGGYDGWTFEGRNPSPLISLSWAVGKKPEELAKRQIRFAEQDPGCYDPLARVKHLDIDGIDVQVLYGDGAMQIQDPELRTVCVHAYNDFLSEFVSAAPGRYIGLGIAPIHDPEASVKEIQRFRKLGLRGIFIGLDGADFPITAPEYDRFWDAAVAERLPVSIHIGGGGMMKRDLALATKVPPGTLEAFITMAPMTVGETLGMLIFGEVLPKRPDLRVVIAEGGIGWLAYYLERIDHVFEKQRFWANSKLHEKPSTYFHRQILATFEEDLAGMRTYDLIGAGNIMFSTDFPHSDTTYPHTREVIERHFSQLPETDRLSMLWENAARLYGIGS
ncbi:MAG: amidohydrolase family protein [Candidatus Binatia bacterium]